MAGVPGPAEPRTIDIRIRKKEMDDSRYLLPGHRHTDSPRQTDRHIDRHPYTLPSPIYTHSYIVHPLDLSKGSAFSY